MSLTMTKELEKFCKSTILSIAEFDFDFQFGKITVSKYDNKKDETKELQSFTPEELAQLNASELKLLFENNYKEFKKLIPGIVKLGKCFTTPPKAGKVHLDQLKLGI